ncbi:MAG: Cellulose-binding domain protein [Myxococcaceae bacterium]|nr:Cellulose-binding domain protein [Myxococcaceae bacterium]
MLDVDSVLARGERSSRSRAWLGSPLVVGVLGCLLSACTGSVQSGPGLFGDAQGSPSSIKGDEAAASGPTGSSLGTPPQTKGFTPAASVLRRLTVRQYQNTALDLFGADADLTTELEPDTALNGFYAIGASKSTVSPSAAEKFEASAYALAAKALDASHRTSFVGCTPAGTIDRKCTTDFVTRFGLRAFRRPLSSAEVAQYVALAEQAQNALGDFHVGLQFAVAGLLQSPNFLFRTELGTPGKSATDSRPFDDYELASRLSYLLWNSTPDPELLQAASNGELTTLVGLKRQAERLLADARARHALDVFHSERLSLDELASLEIDATVYAGLDDGLRRAMRNDVLQTISDLTFGETTDFRALYSTRVVFVDSKLAALYGLPPVTTPTRTELPTSAQRAGLLGKVAFLAGNGHADSTSPTKRGKYIRERLLCQSIPAPPPDVLTVLPAPAPNAPTMRDRLKVHAANASCAGCHALMDPLGLSLEHFDAIGRFRVNDQGHELDTAGSLEGKAFDGEVALSSLLQDDPRTSECLTRQLYRYTVAHVETDGEAAVVDELIAQFKDSNYRFTTLLRAVVASDGFRYGAGE